jgi:hypothetical protein
MNEGQKSRRPRLIAILIAILVIVLSLWALNSGWKE